MAEPGLYEGARHWLASGGWASIVQHAALAAIIVGVAFGLSWMLRMALDRLRRRFTAGAPMIYIVEQLGGYAIIVIGLLAGVHALGVELSSLTVFAGAIGVGAGLGMQGVVKEFVSGVVLIFDPSVQVGDYIEVADGVRGEVVEIGPRATRLRTNDDLHVIIPNSELMGGRVINWTFNEESRRFHIPFTVAEQTDRALVRKVVLAAACALPVTRPDDDLHKTQVWLTGFSGAGLDFDLVVWPTAESSRHPRAMHAAYTWAIHEALEAAGIENANDQIDLTLRNLFGREGDAALRALNLTDRPSAEVHARPARAPNDAVVSVQVDADRNRLQREEAPRVRAPAPEPPAAESPAADKGQV